MTTDASDSRTGTVLSVGPMWKTTKLVAFESTQYNSVEHNYPVYKQELLTIVQTLKKWQVYLLGVYFYVYTDYCTLKYLDTQ